MAVFSRSSAGLLASSWITFASAAVIAISGPIGRAPCDTHGRTSTPASVTPTAPSDITSSSHMRRAAPGPPPALASPPSTGNANAAGFK